MTRVEFHTTNGVFVFDGGVSSPDRQTMLRDLELGKASYVTLSDEKQTVTLFARHLVGIRTVEAEQ